MVALERGGMRTTNPDFAVPLIRDELRFAARHALMQNPARDTLTFRNRQSETALPMRQLGSFLPGEGVGGAGVHWNGVTWRWTRDRSRAPLALRARYGKAVHPADMPLQDWPMTYTELEPYYDRFERTAGVSGKAGNLRGSKQDGGNVFEQPRDARLSAAAARAELRADALRRRRGAERATTRFRARRRTRRAPTPIRTARASAPASTAVTASGSAARPTPRAARTSR